MSQKQWKMISIIISIIVVVVFALPRAFGEQRQQINQIYSFFTSKRLKNASNSLRFTGKRILIILRV